MPALIPNPLRQAIIERAQHRCEYCHKPQIGFYPHEVDHVIAVKHGGATTLENLAFACFQCNRYKGSDLASIDPQTNLITPLLNPRRQRWHTHFRMEDARIIPLTPEARATVALLQLNDSTRIQERRVLQVQD
ncbi:MAG: HNH endonuclease [Chloroflexi bacterium]|nr:HNH endonuclease [Chloroflexota bacterium]